MHRKVTESFMILKKAGRGKHFTVFLACLNILLLSCIGGFFYLNKYGLFLKEKEPRICGAVFPDTADEYYREIITQIEMNIRSEGDLLLSRDCGYDIELQGRQMLELSDSGAEAVFVCPSSEKGLKREILDCTQRGTRVILVGRSCEGEEEAYALITSDDEKAGETLASFIKVELKSARILVLGREEDASSRRRIASFFIRILERNQGEGQLSDRKQKKSNTVSHGANIVSHRADDVSHSASDDGGSRVQIVQQIDVAGGNKEMENARIIMGRELQKGRDFDLVFAADEKLAAGAYSALKEAGEKGSVQIVAVDGSPVGKNMLRSSRYLATVMEYPSILAAEAVRQAYIEDEKQVLRRIYAQVKLVTKSIIYSYDIDKWE